LDSSDFRVEIAVEPSGNPHVQLLGAWVKDNGVPDTGVIERAVTGNFSGDRLSFSSTELTAWDSVLLTFAGSISRFFRRRRLDKGWYGEKDLLSGSDHGGIGRWVFC
jgi:hypothetical protein